MQFTADSTRETNGPSIPGRLVYEHLPETLVGQMCQVIEMLGLRESQERATKDTVKNLIYEAFSFDRGCKYLESELVTVIESVFWQMRRYNEKEGLLTGRGDYVLTMTVPEPKTGPDA